MQHTSPIPAAPTPLLARLIAPRRVALFLLAGTLSAPALALIMARFGPQPVVQFSSIVAPPESQPQTGTAAIAWGQRFGSVSSRVDPGPYTLAERVKMPVITHELATSPTDTIVPVPAPQWLERLALDHSGPTFSGWQARFHATGWPFPALYWGWDSRTGSLMNGFDLRNDRTTMPTLGQVLPLGVVLWPGLPADIAVHSLIWFAAAASLTAARAHLRARRFRRQGLCPKCGYDLRATPTGAACPECGTLALAKRPAPHTAPRNAPVPRRVRWTHLAIASLLLGAPTTWLATWTMALIRPAPGRANVFGTPASAWQAPLVFPKFSENTTNGEMLVDFTGTPVSTIVMLTRANRIDWNSRREYARPASHQLAGDPAWPPVSTWVIPPWTTPVAPAPPTQVVPPDPSSGTTAPAELSVTTVAWGWPLRCLAGTHRITGPTKFGQFSSVYIETHEEYLDSPFKWASALLPLRPLGPGLILNSIIYTLLLFPLLSFAAFTFRSLRARRRHRRGLCPHCAYNLRATPSGSPCPECGSLTKTRQPT